MFSLKNFHHCNTIDVHCSDSRFAFLTCYLTTKPSLLPISIWISVFKEFIICIKKIFFAFCITTNVSFNVIVRWIWKLFATSLTQIFQWNVSDELSLLTIRFMMLWRRCHCFHFAIFGAEFFIPLTKWFIFIFVQRVIIMAVSILTVNAAVHLILIVETKFVLFFVSIYRLLMWRKMCRTPNTLILNTSRVQWIIEI